MKVLIFFCFCVSVILAVEQQTIPTEQPIEQVIEIPIENRLVHRDVLKMHQSKRIAKWGGLKVVKTWPKYYSKLLESAYPNDYISTNISFGTPNQDFVVMLSSGGTRSWVRDKKYMTGNQHGYDENASATSNNTGKNFFEQDGRFNVTGRYFTDHMQFGRSKIKNQAFGVVNAISEENDGTFPIDGVFGLNHLTQEAYSSGKEPTAPIDNLINPLLKKSVTIYMGPSIPPSQGTAFGQITIGGFDSKHCDQRKNPDVFTLSPSKYGDYRYIMHVDSSEYKYNWVSYPGEGYFDTSFSTIILPSVAFQTYYDIILPDYDWDTGLYTVPCNSSTLGRLDIITSRSTFKIKPEHYVIDLDLDDNKCALALEMNGSLETEDYILGTPAARSACVVLDYDNNSLLVYPHD